jgi:Cu(I)/Ag(I) efflux system membrane fusion protein
VRKAALAVVVLAVFGAGFFAGGWSRAREAAGAAGARPAAVLYYVDPMHPAYTSDVPGNAPDCGMALVPVYGDAPPGPRGGPAGLLAAGAVRADADAQRLIGVRVEPVAAAARVERLRLYGRVAADETRSYTVDMGTEGYIRDVSPVTTGTFVRKDQWLATFAAPELRSPLQAYVVALEILDRSATSGETPAQIEQIEASLQLNVDRLLTFGVSRAQIDEIDRTRRVPQYIRVVAPADGIVISRNVSAGQKVKRGDELYRVADLSRVWILADVPGPEALHVPPGAVAAVGVPRRAAPMRARVSGTVRPQFDAATQSVTLRLDADNPDDVLRPGMFVDLEVPVSLPSALTVPAEAILDAGRTRTVFVERGRGVFEPRQVQTGWRMGGRVEIVGGLAAGERIAVSGTFLLDSESRLRRAGADPVSRE